MVTSIANAVSTNIEDTINAVFPSFNLGVLFILSNRIVCYSLFTDVFIETIIFTVTNSTAVLQFAAASTLPYFIAMNTLELILKDFSANSTKRLTSGTPSLPAMAFIRGFFMDEPNHLLYLYGNGGMLVFTLPALTFAS